MAANVEASVGALRGEQVRFCTSCCRVNTSPGPLCFSCRGTQGHRLVRRAVGFSIGRAKRLKVLGAVAIVAALAAGVPGLFVEKTAFVVVAVGFYAALVGVVALTIRRARRLPRCPDCNSLLSRVAQRQTTEPGVPLIGVAEYREECALCGPMAAGWTRSSAAG